MSGLEESLQSRCIRPRKHNHTPPPLSGSRRRSGSNGSRNSGGGSRSSSSRRGGRTRGYGDRRAIAHELGRPSRRPPRVRVHAARDRRRLGARVPRVRPAVAQADRRGGVLRRGERERRGRRGVHRELGGVRAVDVGHDRWGIL